LKLFPSIPTSSQWQFAEDCKHATIIFQSVKEVHTLMDLARIHKYGYGCVKLVVPTGAAAGRVLLAFGPPFQIWNKTLPDGRSDTRVSGPKLMLLETGVLRLPPNATYTDAEETAILSDLIEILGEMHSKEMPLSAKFLTLIGK
jgi:hypothetical protein